MKPSHLLTSKPVVVIAATALLITLDSPKCGPHLNPSMGVARTEGAHGDDVPENENTPCPRSSIPFNQSGVGSQISPILLRATSTLKPFSRSV